MSEWFKEPVLKTGDIERYRGFESYLFRQYAEIVISAFILYGEVPKW